MKSWLDRNPVAGLRQSSTTSSLWPRVSATEDRVVYLNINPDDAYIGVDYRKAVSPLLCLCSLRFPLLINWRDEKFPTFQLLANDLILWNRLAESCYPPLPLPHCSLLVESGSATSSFHHHLDLDSLFRWIGSEFGAKLKLKSKNPGRFD